MTISTDEARAIAERIVALFENLSPQRLPGLVRRVVQRIGQRSAGKRLAKTP